MTSEEIFFLLRSHLFHPHRGLRSSALFQLELCSVTLLPGRFPTQFLHRTRNTTTVEPQQWQLQRQLDLSWIHYMFYWYEIWHSQQIACQHWADFLSRVGLQCMSSLFHIQFPISLKIEQSFSSLFSTSTLTSSKTPTWGWKEVLHYAFPDACFKFISHSTGRWRRREVTMSHEFQTKFWDKDHNAENFAITPFLKQWELTKLHWVLP